MEQEESRPRAPIGPARLGKKFEDYLLQEYNVNEVLSESAIRLLDSDDTIDRILAKNNVSATTLHNFTRLVLVPDRLLTLQGTPIMPALMELFAAYTFDHKIYEYEFGFHCTEAILFALGIGALIEANTLHDYVAEIKMLLGPPTRLPHDILWRYFSLAFQKSKGSIEMSYWGFQSSTMRLVPSLGGFTMADYYYIMNLTWYCRKEMFWSHTITGVSPGWCYGICILWLFNLFISRDDEMTARLYALAIRLELNDPRDEFGLLCEVLWMIRKTPSHPNGGYPSSLPTDKEDAKLILRKYYPYIILPGRRSGHTLPHLMQWAGDVVIWLKELEFYLEFLNTHLRILWSAILETEEPADKRGGDPIHITNLFAFADSTVKIVGPIIKNATPEERTTCFDALFGKGDFVNLMGRATLWCTRANYDIEIEQITGMVTGQLTKLHGSLAELVSISEAFLSDSEQATSYNPSIRADWIKVLDFLEAFQVYKPASRQTICTYLDSARTAWKEFGRMVPYVSIPQCANPKCGKLDPTTACTRCSKALYCNKQCQRHHWNYRAMGLAHSFSCGAN
ncbi:hypothetical protein FRC08_004604 [Ceratobasidium sp. 394]|nr:hypothetical protein FRC08_004604 [Ceratobasidium sp. 394]